MPRATVPVIAFVLALMLAPGLQATLAPAIASPEHYTWKSPTPDGAEPGKPLQIIHGLPRNLTEYDVHLTCSPGSKSLTVAIVTQGFGPYKPQALKGQDGDGVFVIDGRRQPARAMRLTANDHGVEATGEFDDIAPLLRALANGKSLQVELPRIKSRKISLNGLASLLTMMRKHCAL